ncbi:CsbD family protein [Enterobacter hormaechei]|uniref:CsbD family protein n=1 Tax=Enterobacter hormaechei TaxID=158836 RepID=UPI0013D84057|nr:stress-response protein [Enterobacter hormaechei]
MNSDFFVGRWIQLKGLVWQALADWSGSDCVWLAGSNDFLAGVLQEDYGRERDAVSSEKTSH